LGGTVYADIYCILDPKYTVVGPVCRPNTLNVSDATEDCLTEDTVEFCTAKGGTTVGDIFCLLEGEYSALGPLRLGIEDQFGSNNTELDTDVGIEACNAAGGTPIGDKGLFCVIQGNEYHYIGEYWGGGCIGIASKGGTCETDLGGISVGNCGCLFSGDFTVGAPLYWGTTRFQPEEEERDLMVYGDGVGFILKGSYTIYGPNCYGATCYPASGECEKGGGISIGGGIFCAIPKSKTKTTFSFTAEENLPGGIILILSLLSFIVVVQSLVFFFWWRKQQSTGKGKCSIENDVPGENSPSNPDSSKNPNNE